MTALMTQRSSRDAVVAYEHKRRAAADRSRRQAAAAQDIGDIPPVADPARRAACRRDFRSFCETYFSHRFPLAWSDGHLRVIAKIEVTVLRGAMLAIAMPRGSGKTTLCEVAVIWAALYGHHRYVILVGATAANAVANLDNIKAEIETNDLLLADFPEVVYPIRALDGETRRCAGQHHHGRKTRVGWLAEKIVLPTIPGSTAGGSVIGVAGITGNIRGAMHVRPDGVSIRPTLAIVDDPQTEESAASPKQCADRLATVNGAIAGLAGPGQQMAIVIPCTVIHRHDLADQILDLGQNPQWRGERTRTLDAFPTNERLWDQYRELRDQDMAHGGDGSAATQFYAANRAAMDKGAAVAWPARVKPGDLSALQSAMNEYLRAPEAFYAEYQNEPRGDETAGGMMLSAPQIATKVSGLAAGEVAAGHDLLTAFVDVQQAVLYYMVVAWADGFSGHVIDYGTWPDQGRRYFALRDARRTLAIATKAPDLTGQIRAGLETITQQLLERNWQGTDGTDHRIRRLLIDANWGASTETVYRFCRASPHAALISPSHGRYVGASSRPFHEWRKSAGDRIGQYWRMPSVKGKRTIRDVIFDANYWKTFVHDRFAVPEGSAGAITLHGRPGTHHRMLADHMTAEAPVRVSAQGRMVDEWKMRPGQADNHLLDCLVGAAVAASMHGLRLHKPAANPADTTPTTSTIIHQHPPATPAQAATPPARRRRVINLEI